MLCDCGRSGSNAPAAATASTATLRVDSAPVPGAKGACPADGLWHECSVLERLDRSGLAPRRDSGAINPNRLSHRGMLVRVGRAELEVFLYVDEASRAADEKKLDPSEFVEAGRPQSMRQERTL